MSARPILVLVNPQAGSADARGALVERVRAEARATLVEPSGADEAKAVLREASRDAERIVVAGGDGSVHLAVNVLATLDRPPPLGLVRLGTGNDFARSLEIPVDVEAAWALARDGNPRPVDLMEVTAGEETRIAANMLSGGNSGRVLEALTSEIKERWGALAYLRGVLDVEWQPFALQGEDDRGSFAIEAALNFVVANGRTSAGGLPVAPAARVDDGHLDLVAVRDAPLGALLEAGIRELVAREVTAEVIVHRRVRSLTLTMDPPMPCTADGEILPAPASAVRVLEGRLRVVGAGA